MDEISSRPSDCGHKEHQLGCPNCFQEMDYLLKDKLRVSTMRAQISGAGLMVWHVQLVLSDMIHQIQPLTRSLDLSVVTNAKDVITNLEQLAGYFFGLLSNPREMAQAMAIATVTAQEAARSRQEQAPAAASPITLTDMERKIA